MPKGRLLTYNSDLTESEAEILSKIFDRSVLLEFDWKDEDIINKAFSTIAYNKYSLNQSLSYIYRRLLIADIEIKKTLSPSKPELQIAVWKSDGVIKRQHHG